MTDDIERSVADVGEATYQQTAERQQIIDTLEDQLGEEVVSISGEMAVAICDHVRHRTEAEARMGEVDRATVFAVISREIDRDQAFPTDTTRTANKCTDAVLAALKPTEPSEAKVERAGVVDQRTGPISEAMLSSEERTPEAAAERIRAFLNWKGGHVGDVGPSMNYGDLRILSDAALAAAEGQG